MTNIRHYFDAGSLLVILITFALFLTALYFTGFTHDLLLEAGVFLVSVKLILMSYKNTVASDNLHKELAEIRSLIQVLNNKSRPIRCLTLHSSRMRQKRHTPQLGRER